MTTAEIDALLLKHGYVRTTRPTVDWDSERNAYVKGSAPDVRLKWLPGTFPFKKRTARQRLADALMDLIAQLEAP